MLQTITKHIKDVSKIALQGYYQTNELEYKSKIDLVTEYDKAVEKELTKRFERDFKDYTVVGEEFGGSREADKQIIIDPIDGTTNFVHQIPIFGISVGVVENGDPVAGVVYNPVLDEMYTAQRGRGSYCNGKRLRVSNAATLQESLIATGFPYTKIQKGPDYRWTVDSFEHVLPQTRDIRRLGAASIDLCYVAKGVYDGYYEINLKPWDVAAGVLIVTEAGGCISNESGSGYDLDDKLIIATNGHIHDALRESLAKLP